MQGEVEELIVPKRRGLVVWVRNFKRLKVLARLGNIHYVSKKMKYVVLYMDEESIETVTTKLSTYHFVEKIEKSYRPDVEMNFAEKIGTHPTYSCEEDESS